MTSVNLSNPSPSPSTRRARKPVGAPARVLCATLAAGSLAWVQAGCAAAQVRPSPAACPEGAEDAMESVGVEPPSRVLADWDIQQRSWPVGDERRALFESGPITSRVDCNQDAHPESQPHGCRLPEGTLLFGRVWVDEKQGRVYARWTEAELPGGKRLPVCFVPDPFTYGGPFLTVSGPGPRPGTVWWPERGGIVKSVRSFE